LAKYTETDITVGQAPYELHGVLTLPIQASEENPAPACVMIHDFEATNCDLQMGETAFFADLAHILGNMGLASIRYDKRTYAYPDYIPETVWEEIGEDALSAAALLKTDNRIDSSGLVLLGVGLGGMIAPRIASESNKAFSAMILIGSVPLKLIQYDYSRFGSSLSSLDSKEQDKIRNAVKKISSIKESTARELTIFGHNGYYYWRPQI
jgi:hypothetical protein